jgi:WD40 repeat protein
VLLGKQVNGLSFKEGTHLLATASDDTTSMIWDAEKGISVTTLKVWPLLKFLVVNTLRLCLHLSREKDQLQCVCLCCTYITGYVIE